MFEADDYRICQNCNKETYIGIRKSCLHCSTSGNEKIDYFIKKTQLSDFKLNLFPHPEPQHFLKWVPFDNFLGVEYIAKGGFSQIYKATWRKNPSLSIYDKENKRSERQVVLKVLNNSQSVDTKFFNELKLTYQIRSNFIIKCFGVTQDPKTKNYAFILDYAPNGDLHRFLRKNFEKLTWDEKIDLLRDIIIGIKLLHDKKIIHRDLHSGNILIFNNNFETAVISDLGFSQLVTVENSKKPQIYGVIPYMAPELFKGKPCTFASDIYSLGMIMWELTTGHKPFHDQEHGPKIILDILDGKRPEITKDTPECWVKLMERCWHPDPSRRPTIYEIWKLSDEFRYNKNFAILLLHDKKIIHRDLHSGNILIFNNNFETAVISDLGFSQLVTVENSKKPQIYGVIPYMAPELFKGKPCTFASDIYSLGMIMWELTTGHKPFHDQEHGPKIILDILDGKRPEITKDTPECWVKLMERCWHPDPSRRPTIYEIWKLSDEFRYNKNFAILVKKAEIKRLEMIKFNELFVKNPGYEHSRYYSISLISILESINSSISDQFSIDNFDIMK
ncbi:hypothetical protein Glove_853g12 [Diversispora epigaea]|uniref:Protein kinase domain-containing protein n=1 Tax=Diversispora epigaea TaxID=1348612 RepID=A0A397G2L6_9GLOM|nr:hypothetical protein Glove_853g12 [Diversispora epigaea]